MLEIIGYIGSALVVISMLMSSIVKLRVINTVGSIISAVYALLCGALPLALMNFCLIIINVYNLIKVLKSQKTFDFTVADTGDAMLRTFLDHYDADIKKYFPSYDISGLEGNKAYVAFYEGSPVGVTLARVFGDDLDICIDYSVPSFRDCSVGRFIYTKLKEQGIKKLLYRQTLSEEHLNYLRGMNYIEKDGAYELDL